MRKAVLKNATGQITVSVEEDQVLLSENDCFINSCDVSNIDANGYFDPLGPYSYTPLSAVKIAAAYQAISDLGFQKTKVIKRHRSSYNLKHVIERSESYRGSMASLNANTQHCSNGDLIAAMWLHGFKSQTMHQKMDVYFNLAYWNEDKSIKPPKKSQEIKFRAYDLDYGKMSEPFYLGEPVTVISISESGGHSLELNPPTPIMQFTGAYDAKGNEIYVNDVVSIDGVIAQVVYENHGFFLKYKRNKKNKLKPIKSGEISIIGNIYDYPEFNMSL